MAKQRRRTRKAKNPMGSLTNLVMDSVRLSSTVMVGNAALGNLATALGK